MSHLHIAIVNQATVDLGDLDAAVAALALQAQHHVAVAWEQRPPEIERFDTPPGGKWQPLVVLDDADQAGALGYHDEANGQPYGRVFAKTCQANGVSWTSCASHELAEMMGDDRVDEWANQDATLWARELCDPVESCTYLLHGVEVSDFVLPAWFDAQAPRPFSFMDLMGLPGAPGLTGPFQVAKGGYAIVARCWPQVTQVFADGAETPEQYPAWRLWGEKLAAGSRSLRRY